MMILKICLVVTIVGCQLVLANVGMGPLNINLINIKTCDGDEGVFTAEVVSIENHKKGFDMECNLPWPLDEQISYSIRVDEISNGDIKENVFSTAGDYACEDMDKFMGNFWRKLLEKSGASADCPVAEGSYSVKNFPFDEKDMEVDSFFYGRFLLYLTFKRNDDIFTCMIIEFTNNRPGESA